MATGPVSAPVTTRSAGTTDKLQVNALGGDDAVRVDDNAKALLGVSVDLGSGQY
jgi:hypothetical protein